MKKQDPKVSIIIPLYVIEDRFFTDLKKFEKLDYPSYEILVVCDKKVDLKGIKRARLILTNKYRTGPAEKRDIAFKHARGNICAFIDDDAYPDPKWLRNATMHFKDKNIVAVGGPGVTPPEDDCRAQLTGMVYSSFFCGGLAQYRFIQKEKKYVDDYPAYNLIVRKNILKKVGGYGTHFYGGEDTFLCLKIINLGFKILYDPDTVVYHHRRDMFIPYLAQISNIGKHRGYFAKKYPETSRRLFYYLPSSLLIVSTLSIVVAVLNVEYRVYIILFYLAGFMSVFFSFREKHSLLSKVAATIGIYLTHIVYGFSFLVGYSKKDMKR